MLINVRFRTKKRFNNLSALFMSVLLINCIADWTLGPEKVRAESKDDKRAQQSMPLDKTEHQKMSAIDDIIKKHAHAIGYENIKNVETIRVRGKFRHYVHGDINEATYTVVLKRPDWRRFEVENKRFPIIVAYDGKTVWTINPYQFHGSLEANRIEGMSARQILFDTQFFPSWSSPIIHYRERSNTVKLLEKVSLQGTVVYKLAARIKYGMETHWYISSEDYLLKRMTWRPIEGLHTYKGQGTYVHICFDDYKDVNGNMVPHVIKDKVDGVTVKEYIILEIEMNVKVDDAFFRMPQ